MDACLCFRQAYSTSMLYALSVSLFLRKSRKAT